MHGTKSLKFVRYRICKKKKKKLRILTQTPLNKLVCTAQYNGRCLINVAIPVKFVACFLPVYPQSLTLNSNKQQITQKALNSDVLHTDRHSGCVCNAATAAARLSPGPKFGTLDSTRRIENLDETDSGRSPAEIVGSNPTGGMDICLL